MKTEDSLQINISTCSWDCICIKGEGWTSIKSGIIPTRVLQMTVPRYFCCESSLFVHCPFVFFIFETVLFCVAVSSDQILILCTAKTMFCDWSFLGIFAYANFVEGSVCICSLGSVLALSFGYSIHHKCSQELSELGLQTLDKAVLHLNPLQVVYGTCILNVKSTRRVRVCAEGLQPSQHNRVMSSAVSLPNHTFS